MKKLFVMTFACLLLVGCAKDPRVEKNIIQLNQALDTWENAINDPQPIEPLIYLKHLAESTNPVGQYKKDFNDLPEDVQKIIRADPNYQVGMKKWDTLREKTNLIFERANGIASEPSSNLAPSYSNNNSNSTGNVRFDRALADYPYDNLLNSLVTTYKAYKMSGDLSGTYAAEKRVNDRIDALREGRKY